MYNKEYLKNSNTYSLYDTIDKINYYIFHVIEDPLKQHISSYKIDKVTNDITGKELLYIK